MTPASRTPERRREYYLQEKTENERERKREYYREWTKKHLAAMTPEQREEYKANLNESHRLRKQERKRHKLYSMGSHRRGKIKILWPGCGDPEYVSKTLFESWRKSDIPAGTQVWMDSEETRR